jgi:hypothetical protein
MRGLKRELSAQDYGFPSLFHHENTFLWKWEKKSYALKPMGAFKIN